MPTLEEYLDYLARSYLISMAANFSKGLRKGPRTLKKLYVASPNFIAAATGVSPQSPMFNTAVGVLVETAVFNRLRELADVFFWRVRETEIDFIASLRKGVLPLEVKYRSSIRPQDMESLFHFMERQGISKGSLVTRRDTGKEGSGRMEITKIPAMAFL